MSWRIVLATVTASSLLFGCTSSSGGESDGSSVSGANVSSMLSLTDTKQTSYTDETGEVTFQFSIAKDTVGAQFEVFSEVGKLSLIALRGPSGLIPLSIFNDPTLSPAQVQGSPNVLKLPLPNITLQSGRYTATYLLTDVEGEEGNLFVEIGAHLLSKKDQDISTGAVMVNLILVGPLGGSDEFRSDLEDAFAETRKILARGQIFIDAKFYQLTGSDRVPDPKNGSTVYENLVNQVRPHSVNIVFAGEVEGLAAPTNEYSSPSAGYYPASISGKSIVAVSVRDLIGSDGRFDYDGEGADQVNQNEKRAAAEEMSQLIGHALGLSHIVEIEGDQVRASDNLADTPSCVSLPDCREDKGIRENFMFPYPLEIPESDNEDYQRTGVSAGQAEVMQRSILVD